MHLEGTDFVALEDDEPLNDWLITLIPAIGVLIAQIIYLIKRKKTNPPS